MGTQMELCDELTRMVYLLDGDIGQRGATTKGAPLGCYNHSVLQGASSHLPSQHAGQLLYI